MSKNVTITLTEQQAVETLRILRLWMNIQTDSLYGEGGYQGRATLRKLTEQVGFERTEQEVCECVEQAEAAANNIEQSLRFEQVNPEW